MGVKTEIQWTDHTFNPWWGCLEVSPGCDHCYARTLAERWGFKVWGPPHTSTRRLFGDAHWSDPLKWNAGAADEGRRHRVFCASMADVFEFHPHRDQVFRLDDTSATRSPISARYQETPDFLTLDRFR
jgi:protein gp37